MEDLIKNTSTKRESTTASGQLTDAYRRFARTLGEFSDLSAFAKSLDRLLRDDPHLLGSLLIQSADSVEATGEPETFKKGSVVIPFRDTETAGYVRVGGRRDGRAFGAEDLRLMGAMAGFVSALYAQARSFGKMAAHNKVLQFLIDQIPLGVLCFGSDGVLISGNSKAWQLLGVEVSADDAARARVLEDFRAGVGTAREAHFEVEGRLMFAVRRRLDVSVEAPVTAYVLYDLSPQREKLADSLDREYYKARCVEAEVTVALVRSRSNPGDVYRYFKERVESMELSSDWVQPLDAFTCAMICPSRSLREARCLVKNQIANYSTLKDVEVAFIIAEDPDERSPSEFTLRRAASQFAPAASVLKPHVLVLDAYQPVFETLEMILDEKVCLASCSSVKAAEVEMESGSFDGLIFDLDSFGDEGAGKLLEKARGISGFKLILSSVKQRHMFDREILIEHTDCVLQKPFDALKVLETLSLCFNLP